MYFNRRNMYYQSYPYFSPFGFLQQQERSYAQAALAAQAKLQAYRLSALSQQQLHQQQQQQQQHEQQEFDEEPELKVFFFTANCLSW
ncbi:serum response factor homolog A-like [Penaeus japonicus]|uniref:serum response factor homolog A-like n=1 Tax=Penaeus japonicus TaxID=27405 RepID=UPI001C70B8C5|nr:serum response factor homolog A-like [Penaeus japonicus]